MHPAFMSPAPVAMSPVVLHQRQSAVPARFEVEQPITVLVTSIDSKRWKLIQPLILKYEQDADASHLVSDDVFLVYGVGEDIDAAMADYTRSLLEYYEIVAANVTDHATRMQFSQIRQYLQRTS